MVKKKALGSIKFFDDRQKKFKVTVGVTNLKKW
jgi:hypothetical protein